MPGFGASPVDLHLSCPAIEPAFVTFTLRASPYDPVSLTVTGAVVRFFGKAVEIYFAHKIEMRVWVNGCGKMGRGFVGPARVMQRLHQIITNLIADGWDKDGAYRSRSVFYRSGQHGWSTNDKLPPLSLRGIFRLSPPNLNHPYHEKIHPACTHFTLCHVDPYFLPC